jgi:hypothetical protein
VAGFTAGLGELKQLIEADEKLMFLRFQFFHHLPHLRIRLYAFGRFELSDGFWNAIRQLGQRHRQVHVRVGIIRVTA